MKRANNLLNVVLCAGAFLIGASTAANANVTFNVVGTFALPTPLPFNGTMTVDPVTGLIVTDGLYIEVGQDPNEIDIYHVTNLEGSGTQVELQATNGGATFNAT